MIKIGKTLGLYGAYTFNRIAPPITTTIFTSRECNLGCVMCWRRTKSGEDRFKWKPVPKEKWESTIRELGEMGCKKLEFSGGGEPLLYKGFKDLARLAKSLGMPCTLTTNGTLLDKDMVDFLNEINWDIVTISLDGPDKETNNKIRGWGFDEVMKHLEYISVCGRKFKVYLQTVILPSNYKKFDKMMEICKKFSFDGITFLPFCDFKEYTNNFYESMPKTEKEFNDFTEDVKKELRSLAKMADEYKLRTNIKELIEFSLQRRVFYNRCYYPWIFCTINESGNVLPCCQLSNANKEFYLGNIREESIKKIWYGKQFTELRRKFKKGFFYVDCNDCMPSTFNGRVGHYLNPISSRRKNKIRHYMEPIDPRRKNERRAGPVER